MAEIVATTAFDECHRTLFVGTVATVPAGARVIPGDGRVGVYQGLTPGTQDAIGQCPVRRLDNHLVRCDHLTGGAAVTASWLPPEL